jgi:hypothetical protein
MLAGASDMEIGGGGESWREKARVSMTFFQAPDFAV